MAIAVSQTLFENHPKQRERQTWLTRDANAGSATLLYLRHNIKGLLGLASTENFESNYEGANSGADSKLLSNCQTEALKHRNKEWRPLLRNQRDSHEGPEPQQVD
jgi:hypothetical protein